MRTLIMALGLLAASPAIAKPVTPAELERETWQLFKDKKADAFKAMFAPDFVGVYADGVHDLAKEVQSIGRVTLNDYKLSDFKSQPLDADDVLLTYAADVHATVGGKAVAERLWVASLWHRSGGRWLTVYHTEVKAQ